MLKKSLLHSAILLRWQARGSPSMANPLSGIKLHWSFILFRFAPVFFQLENQKRGFCFSPFSNQFRDWRMLSRPCGNAGYCKSYFAIPC
jgi:hypothetical protein